MTESLAQVAKIILLLGGSLFAIGLIFMVAGRLANRGRDTQHPPETPSSPPLPAWFWVMSVLSFLVLAWFAFR